MNREYLLAIMKRLRIIKRRQSEPANESPVENKKADQTSTRKMVNTVKGWVAESQERKRSRRRSLTALGLLVLISFSVAMGPITWTDKRKDAHARGARYQGDDNDHLRFPWPSRDAVQGK
jgi:hypothetical protein